MRVLVVSALLVLLAGCSSQPTTQDSSASGATPVPPPPPAEMAVPAPEPSVTQSATGEKTGGKIPSGYRRETRNGKELYCRQVTTLGSRFPQKTCFTRAQLEEIQRRTESTLSDMDRGLRVCSGEGCSSN